jgi:hypothetical protein
VTFKNALDSVRFKQGDSWFDRSQKGVEALDDLRHTQGFKYLMDVYDGNIRSLWNMWLDPETTPEQAEAIRVKARWLRDLVNELDEISSTKALQDLQAKQYEGFTADGEIAAAYAQLAEAGNS